VKHHKRRSFNDQVSSIRVYGKRVRRCYRKAYRKAYRQAYTKCHRVRVIKKKRVSFNDQVSSIRVYGHKSRRCYIHRKCHHHCYLVPDGSEKRKKAAEKKMKETVSKKKEKAKKMEKKQKEKKAKEMEKRSKERKYKERVGKEEKRNKERSKKEKMYKEKNMKKERKAKERAVKEKMYKEKAMKKERNAKERAYKVKKAEKQKKEKLAKHKKEQAKKAELKQKEKAKKEKQQKEKAKKAEMKQKEKAKKEKTSKEKAKKAEMKQKEKAAKEKTSKEKAMKAEKKEKEKRKKETKAKEMTKKAEKRQKEAFEKYKAASAVLEKISADCNVKAQRHIKALKQTQMDQKLVASATKTKIKVCTAQKKAKEIADKGKEKLFKARKNNKINGPGFKFGKNPCKKGFGSFKQKLALNQRVNVGLIPAGQVNVRVELNTDKDVDTELWTADGKSAVVAWRCLNHQSKKMKAKCIDSATKKIAKYMDIKIEYSGWLGVNAKFGHEYIRIIGKSKHAFMIRAFGYEAGWANVKYSWDGDAKQCKIWKQEKKTKHQLKKSLEEHKEMSNEKIEHLLKAVKSCKHATSTLAKAKLIWQKSQKTLKITKTALKKCHAKKQAHAAKLKKMKKRL